jgi:hypothetical protein
MSECFDQEIDGKDFKTYVKDTALENTKEFAAVNAKFDELGLELSEEDLQTISDNVSSAWEYSGDLYEAEGISKDSLTQCYQLSYKRSAIFDYYYAEGGIEEVSDDDIQTYVNENYMRYKCVSIAKSTNEDEDAAAEENEELKTLVDGYLAEAEDLDFAGFDTIIDEYSEYQAEQAAAEEEAEEAAEEAVEEVEETEEEAVTELESEADETESSEADTDSEIAEDTDESEAEDEAVTDESEADSDEDAEEEEEDPYANETVMMYTDALDSDSDSYDETYAERIQAFKDAEYGVATLYENDSYYYLFITADVAERTDYVEDNKDTLLDEMKGDDFDALVKDWVDALDLSVNDKAIKRYTVQEVYDRETDYYSSNS